MNKPPVERNVLHLNDTPVCVRDGGIQPIERYPTVSYISSLRAASSRTMMESTLNCFARELGLKSHRDIDWPQLTDYHIQTVLTAMLDRGISPTRGNTYLSAIKQSAKLAWLQGEIEQLHYAAITNIKSIVGFRHKKGRALKESEIADLFLKNPRGWKDIRDNAIIAITLGCGLRRSELLGLKIKDLCADGTPRITVIGKRNKQRTVRIPQSAMKHLAPWIDLHKQGSINSEALFCRFHKSNSPSATGITNSNTIYTILAKRVKGLNMEYKASPHDLRRTTATLLYKNNIALELIQDILGHENIQTTKLYVEIEQSIYDDAMQHVKF